MSRVMGWVFGLVVVVGGMVSALCWFKHISTEHIDTSNPTVTVSNPENRTPRDSDTAPDPSLPKLPETSPPPGLPIVAWGKRDHFQVIRSPKYWSADEGDKALARDEPVLGLVIKGKSWAFSTNQLNDHEMVVDTLAGTPVLVTY